MDIQDIGEKIKDVAGTPAGKIGIGVLIVGGAVYLVRRNRTASQQPLVSGIVAGTAPVQSQSSGSGGTSSADSAVSQIQAQAQAQKDLLAAQTQQQKDLASFQIGLNQTAAQNLLDQQTATFDALYGGNDVSMLGLAGIDDINPRTGQALQQVAPGTRTARIPVSGSGLEGGLPSEAGKSVLDTIAEALGLGIRQGESRASVQARLSAYNASQANKEQIAQLNASDESYLRRLTAQYDLQREATADQFAQQQAIQQEQIKAQERANNPFSSWGNFLKTAGAIYAGSRSVEQPQATATQKTFPGNPRTTPTLVNTPGEYAMLEPVYRSIQDTGTPGANMSLFAGVA